MAVTIRVDGAECPATRLASGKFGAVYRIRLEGDAAARFPEGTAVVAKRLSPCCRDEQLVHERLADSPAASVVPRCGGRDDTGDWFLMEHVDGLHPHEVATHQSWPELLRVALGIALAYKKIHLAGVFHRDVHSANLLLRPDEDGDRSWPRVTVLDFGLALQNLDRSTTAPGLAFPNPDGWAQERTAAPEAHDKGASLTQASETFAVCAMVWRLFDEQYPFGPYRRGVPLRQQREQRRPLPAAAAAAGLADFFERGLAPDPAARYPRMSLVVQALARAAESAGFYERKPPREPREPRPEPAELAVEALASPNFDSRRDTPIRFVVLHHTALSLRDTLSHFRSGRGRRRVSAHYVVDRDGRVIQLVDDAQRAWHAGVAHWRGERRDINAASIGLDLVNRGDGRDPFPAPQLDALASLLRHLMARHSIPAARVVGHRDVAWKPGRKHDPADNFDWRSLFARL